MAMNTFSRPISSSWIRSRIGKALGAGIVCAAATLPTSVLAHGFVGQRFFPATIATDDPFVADELSLPTISSVRTHATDDTPASRQTTVSIDVSKRITEDLGISLGASRQRTSFGGVQPAATGNNNLELGLKYQLYKNPATETLVSAGLGWEVGGTGSASAGADSFSTYTPTVFFGRGFGDLPAGFEMLRPFAVAGTLGVAIPGRSGTTTTSVDADTGATVTQVERHPHVLQVGMSLQYSLPYLQSFVKDVGLGAPWNRMIPVLEIAAEKPLDRVSGRRWTGTVNPGVLWVGRTVQVGVEAIVPINRGSGRGVGVQAQLHFFLDDIFPKTLGKPLFGGRP
jgi:hypothetical protein